MCRVLNVQVRLYIFLLQDRQIIKIKERRDEHVMAGELGGTEMCGG